MTLADRHPSGTEPTGPLARLVEPGMAGLLTLITIFWASGLPLWIGVRVYAEQILISVLCLAMALCFVTRPANRGAGRASVPWYDKALAAIAILFGIYLTWRFPVLADEVFYRPVEAMIVAAVGLTLLLEALRRGVGYSLIVVLGLVCLYALFSDQLEGPLQSRAVSPRRLLTFMVLDSAALAGAALYIAVAVVLPFVLLAKLLLATGGSAFFSDVSSALLGRSRGGSAKIAIVASGLFGSISGSAVSNVASTGGITIPLMKQGGYRARTAAAIEATASTGGQLMPPIMGAAAFLLAENLQVPYREVILAALIPAILYYLSLFLFADLEAARSGIAPVDAERIPPLGRTLARGWFILLPFAILIVSLFQFGLPPETAALIAAASLAIVSLFRTYGGDRLRPADYVQVLVDTGRSAIDIVLICAVAGIVIGLFSLSGLSFGLSFFLVLLGKTSLWLLLAVTAVVCILLGMGMPTVGVYLLLSTLAAPPLIELGLLPMAAHLFVLYFGMMSMITPPVAIAAFVAANMAQAEPMRTGVEAVRVAWPAYVVPFLFATAPALIMADDWIHVAIAAVTAGLGVYAVTMAIVGYAAAPLAAPSRAGFAVAGIALLLPHSLFDGAAIVTAAGLAVAAALWLRTRGRAAA